MFVISEVALQCVPSMLLILNVQRKSSTSLILYKKYLLKAFLLVSGQLPPRKIVPRLGLGFRSRSGLALASGATRQFPPRKVAPR